MIRIIPGDALEQLYLLPADSVNMCVTSPPYYNLRSYLPDGHEDKHREIGLEPTPDEYIAALVAVFREVRRVLRPDGTLWVNLGDAFSSGVANIPDLLTRRLKSDVFFFGRADPRGCSAERIHVLIYDKTAPNPIFKPLFRAQRVLVKQGQYDLCQVGGALNTPVECWIGGSLLLRSPQDANAQRLVYLPENVGIIVTAGNLHANPTFRDVIALTIKHRETSFPIEVPGEPVAEGYPADIAIWDAVTLNAGAVGLPDIDPVNQPITFFDSAYLSPGGNRDFLIRSATDEHIALDLKRGSELRFQSVAQLFLLRDGLTPYRNELASAIKYWNANRQKQELGIPDLVKRALMEDGWICRQTIIWSKSNPMPESVQDRCTKAHEYIFLLSKSERYYYDAAAIAEPSVYPGDERHLRTDNTIEFARPDNGSRLRTAQPTGLTRNKRSVWTVASQPSPETHFAQFPPALILPAILAGCPRECCAKCGAPWARIVEKTGGSYEARKAAGVGGPYNGKPEEYQTCGNSISVTRGWAPSCACAAATAPGTCLDPFAGAGTTGLVADRLGRDAILIELSPAYCAMLRQRILGDAPLFVEFADAAN